MTIRISWFYLLIFPSLLTVYQTYIGAMNERIRSQIGINNPFVFKHISNLKVYNYNVWSIQEI